LFPQYYTDASGQQYQGVYSPEGGVSADEQSQYSMMYGAFDQNQQMMFGYQQMEQPQAFANFTPPGMTPGHQQQSDAFYQDSYNQMNLMNQ